MKAINIILVSILLGSVTSGCESVVSVFAFHPDKINVVPKNELPSGIQEIVVNTEDKVNITSLYLSSIESEKLVIYFHGNAGNIYHRIPSLIQLNKFGINVIGVSYRGYGKSQGNPSEEGVYLDGKAMFQYAVNHLGFSENKIVILGRSIGTTVAIDLAQNKNIGGVILVTPLTSGKDQAEAGGLGLLSYLTGNSFDNITKIQNIKAPLLVIHGTNDSVVPYSMGEKIFERATTEKKWVKIKGADHNNLQHEYSQEYWRSIGQFIKSI